MKETNLKFEIRYAINALDLDASLWRKLGFALKMLSYLSATAAIAAITAVSQPVAIALAIMFAVAQGFEYFASPSDKAREAMAMCERYKQLLADLLAKPEEQVLSELEQVRAIDTIKVCSLIKECAYNQTVREHGLDDTHCYAEGRLHKLASSLL